MCGSRRATGRPLMAQAGCSVVARVWVRGVSVTACQTSPPAGSDVSAERGASGVMCGFGPRTGKVDLPSPRLGRPRKARLWGGRRPPGCARGVCQAPGGRMCDCGAPGRGWKQNAAAQFTAFLEPGFWTCPPTGHRWRGKKEGPGRAPQCERWRTSEGGV